MATTKLQAVVDLARYPLNDADKDRYSDENVLMFVNQAIQSAYRLRPDLFFGRLDSLPSLQATLGSVFPMPDQYVQAVADYATARMQTLDDENVGNGKAAAFLQLFGAQLNG